MIRAGMDVNYARLCLPYLAATALLKGAQGSVGLDDFDRAALDDPARHALAACVHSVPNACTDPNALAPQTLRVTLLSGAVLTAELPAVLGHPERPLPDAAQRLKFDRCCAHAGLDAAAADRLHSACGRLLQCTDVADWIGLMQAAPGRPSTPTATTDRA